MKKGLQTKINQLYGKIFRLNQEYNEFEELIKAEHKLLEAKYTELEKKYEEEENPSDSLIERLEKAEEDFNELDELLSGIDDYSFSEILSGLKDYIDGKAEEYKQKELSDKPKNPSRIYIKVEKREFFEQNNGFILHLVLWTNIAPYPLPYKASWSEADNAWLPLNKEYEKLPWLGGGNMYKYFIDKKNLIFSNLYNGTAPSIATLTKGEKNKVTLSYSPDVPLPPED